MTIEDPTVTSLFGTNEIVSGLYEISKTQDARIWRFGKTLDTHILRASRYSVILRLYLRFVNACSQSRRRTRPQASLLSRPADRLVATPLVKVRCAFAQRSLNVQPLILWLMIGGSQCSCCICTSNVRVANDRCDQHHCSKGHHPDSHDCCSCLNLCHLASLSTGMS
jgi:hypothetical protein